MRLVRRSPRRPGGGGHVGPAALQEALQYTENALPTHRPQLPAPPHARRRAVSRRECAAGRFKKKKIEKVTFFFSVTCRRDQPAQHLQADLPGQSQ